MAFSDPNQLAQHPDVDLVTVSVNAKTFEPSDKRRSLGTEPVNRKPNPSSLPQ